MRNDSASAPISDRFSLDDIIAGLASDLQSLRDGKISAADALARAALAKQLMGGVRLVVQAQVFLERRARLVGPSDGGIEA